MLYCIEFYRIVSYYYVVMCILCSLSYRIVLYFDNTVDLVAVQKMRTKLIGINAKFVLQSQSGPLAAYVQFLRIDGSELTDPIIDEAVIQGNLDDLISVTEAKFNAHNTIAIDITSKDREQRNPQYPRAG